MPTFETRTIATAWYHEPWPWMLIAGPLLVVIASMITLSLAISSDDGLVADDYYKQGLAINKTLHREDVARAAGLRGDLAIASDNRQLRVTLTGTLPPAQSLRLYIIHPTRGNADQTVDLRPVGDSRYLGMFQQSHRPQAPDRRGRSRHLAHPWRTGQRHH